MRRVKRKVLRNIIIFCLALSLLCILFIALLERAIRPAMNAIAEVRVRYYAVSIMNDAIREVMSEEGNFDSVVDVVKDENGAVKLVRTDSLAISRISTQVSMRAQEMLQELKDIEISIPAGSLINSGLLSGKGPDIHITMLPAGAVSTDFSTEFENAGINQTRHKVYLHVTALVRIVAPLSGSAIEVSTAVPINEMVIVGEVPDTYINVDDGNGRLNLVP